MRLGLAQLNPIVGDLAGNRRLILDAYAALVAQGAELVVYPELVVCGYPPRDLLFKRRFVPDVAESLAQIAAAIGAVPALVGTVELNPTGRGRPFYNSAAFCYRGTVAAVARKCLLPTYDVFDEDRYFEPATSPTVLEHAGHRIGVTICEDIWTHPMISTRRLYGGRMPIDQLADQKCDLMVNLSASPWHSAKDNIRQHLVVAEAARSLGCPVAYVNAIGGNDELIFDGRSHVCDARGTVTAGLAAFAEELRVVDVPLVRSDVHPATAAPSPAARPVPIAPSFAPAELADIYHALVLGLRDYATKSGFKRALVALSGGIDSAVVAVLAAAAFGPENVIGVSLPSSISSQHSRDDARLLAANLGLRFETIAIADAVAAAEAALGPLFAGRAPDVTEENIQARIRGVLMMAISNKFGSLLLTTGNKSEMAVGYATLYGDMAGGFAPIKDCSKLVVYQLAAYRNALGEVIPQRVIDRPPSAELRPDQKDSDSLPPYEILDPILECFIEDDLAVDEIVARGFDRAVVGRVLDLVKRNEYKRRQAPPGVRVSRRAFGRDWRYPITSGYRR